MHDDTELQEGAQAARRSARPPVFNLPNIVMAALGLLVALFVLQDYVLDDWTREEFLLALSFSPQALLPQAMAQSFKWIWTPVSYSLLHGGIEHLVFNGLWLMVFGTPVARRIGNGRFVAFWLGSAIAAALFHAALNWGGNSYLIGASGVVSALTGAACRFAFPERGGFAPTQGLALPRHSILGALRNRTVAVFAGVWLALNLLIAVGINLAGADMGAIAWDAHIGGFLFGFLLFGLFDRPVAPQPWL